VEKEKIYRLSEHLQSAQLNVSDFAQVIDKVRINDLVFLDPPYTVSHNKNGFIKYNQKIFSLDDQYRLFECVQEIKLRKAFYILTNAAHDVIRNIFNTNDNFYEVQRSSLIGGKKATRGRVSEFIFTNIDLGI
jgi:DNA adenine methylase